MTHHNETLKFACVLFPADFVHCPNFARNDQIQHQKDYTTIILLEMANQIFHPFPRLPEELRLLIWTQIASEPRTVLMMVISGTRGTPAVYQHLYTQGLAPVPSVFHTNHESRTHAEAIYDRAFTNGIEPRCTFINFTVDTIAIPSEPFENLAVNDLRKFRKLLLIVHDGFTFVEWTLRNNIGELAGVEELTIDAVEDDYQWYGCGSQTSDYNGDLGEVRRNFEESFSHIEGWVFPKLRLIQAGCTFEWKAGAMSEPIPIWDSQSVGAIPVFGEE